MTKYFDWFFDLIFPKYCLGCGQENTYLCTGCFASIPALSGVTCFKCGLRSPQNTVCPVCQKKHHPQLKNILVASDWNNPLLRQIIYAYKYNFIKELAECLSQTMIDFIENTGNEKIFKEAIIIPVPLHKRRLAWRGFNQALLLAQAVGKYFDLPIEKEIMERNHYTLPQVEIKNKKDRERNTKNIFKINPRFAGDSKTIKNKTVILIDDVSTTGSTLEECARTLKPLKPKEVWGLVIARG